MKLSKQIFFDQGGRLLKQLPTGEIIEIKQFKEGEQNDKTISM